MSNLKFAETHNLVAFLDKLEESDGFEGIIDFLNASSIRYALTVNLTIYTSCIKQFWATAKAKTVNGEVQIQALVDGKKVIVIKTSVRIALQLKDVKVALWPQLSSVLPQTKNFNFSKYIFDNMVKNLEGGVKFLMYPRVLDLENTKTSQAAEITKLKERVKTQESRNKSRTPRLKRLRKVGRSAQVVSSEDEMLQETTVDELTLAQTLIEIKAAKPKVVTTTATTNTTVVTKPKARGVVVQEPNDRFMELAGRLQAQEQEELNVEEKSKLFVELMDKRQNILQDLEQKSRKENPTKASEGEIYASSLVYMDSEVVERRVKEKDEGSVTRAEESNSKKAGQGTKLEQERIKKQKIDDDQEEVEMKKHMEIIVDEEEIAVDAIPLATKPLIIVD
ncbi:hypothetical protein Tco_1359731 [Tanacetum coccineum]